MKIGKIEIDKTLLASVGLHVLVLGWGIVLVLDALARGDADQIDAGRYHLRRSALQDHRRHQIRQEGESEAAGRGRSPTPRRSTIPSARSTRRNRW